MSKECALIVIALCACIVFFERSLPWLIFGRKKMPTVVKKLGDLLPSAMMVILVVYSLKGLTNTSFHEGFSLIFASLFTAVFHYYKRNQILSVFMGTAVYMILYNLF